MSQSRNDYWWQFIEDLEKLYILSSTIFDRNIGNNIYTMLYQMIDYIHGNSDSGSIRGVIYGFKAIPQEQNTLYAGGNTGYFNLQELNLYGENLVNSSNINYNIRCINSEFQPTSAGILTLSPGTIYDNGNIFDIGLNNNNSSSMYTPIELYPPSNLNGILITSCVYYYNENFYVQNLESNAGYIIGQAQDETLTINNNYIKRIYDTSLFPQPPVGSIDIGRIVWRIGTTEGSIEDHIYEYYIIDTRKVYGYYGLKQIEGMMICKSIFDSISSNYDMSDVIKQYWSVVFNDMSWGAGGFITYWEDLGKTVSDTIKDLYTELT